MRRLRSFPAWTVIFLWFAAARANAAFTKIYNLPSDVAPYSLAPNTQLNLSDGGYLPDQFYAGGWGANSNSELNIQGGIVGYNLTANSGSTINVSGGRFQSGLHANYGSTINISGGKLGHGIEAAFGSNVAILGGEFLLDGLPVAGLNHVGDTVAVDIPTNSTLSGVYANGTPFILTGNWDRFENGTLHLRVTDLPPVGPANLISSAGPVPSGIRKGQTLTVDSPIDWVQAGAGSTVNVSASGIVNLEAIGAAVNVNGGLVSGGAYTNSVVDVFSGGLDSFFSVHGETVVNLYGGRIGYQSQIYGGVLNIFGGFVDDRFSALGGKVNFYGGQLSTGMTVENGAVLNIVGGESIYGGATAVNGTVNLSKGTVANLAGDQANLNLSGGRILESLSAGPNSVVTLTGGEFVFDGQLIDGLDTVGNSRQVSVPDGSVLSGVLQDGTPFSFSSSDLSDTSYAARSDHLAGAIVIVRRGALPAIGQIEIRASTAPVPAGLRRGQTLTVDSGATVGAYFGAGIDSVVNVTTGGLIDHDFEAAGAKVHIAGGRIGYNFDIGNGSVVDVDGGQIEAGMDVFGGGVVNLNSGSIADYARIQDRGVLNVFGGRVGQNLTVYKGGVANILGGSVGKDFQVSEGGTANISGGVIEESIHVREGGTANVSGGTFETGVFDSRSAANVTGGLFKVAFLTNEESNVTISGGEFRNHFQILAGSKVRILGGNIDALTTIDRMSQVEIAGGSSADQLTVNAGSNVTISGGEFRLNGQIVPGLNAINDNLQVDLPSEFELTGVLADGTAFAYSSEDYDRFAAGTLRLKLATLPTPAPRQIVSPHDPLPQAIRGDQVLTLNNGGVLGNNFMAGRQSTINVEAGASVGANLEAIGATVNIRGGKIGPNLDALADTSINISAGTVGPGAHVGNGAMMNITGGTIGSIYADSGSVVNISGGEVGLVRGRIGTRINISGGRIGDGSQSNDGAEITFSGGTIGDHFALGSHGTLTIIGDDFRVNGQPVGNLQSIGDSTQVAVDTFSALTGVLQDGTPFAFAHLDSDYIFDATLILRKSQVAPVGPLVLASRDALPYGIRGGQHLIVDAGAHVGVSFNVGEGSTVDLLSGGTIDRNLEVIGGTVNVKGGSIGSDSAAFAGSVVNVRDGVVGPFFQAFSGSEVNIYGGRVNDVTAQEGSAINIYDGVIAGSIYAYPGGVVNISGGDVGAGLRVFDGSHCNVFGTAFALDGVNIAGLQIGVPVEIRQRDLVLSGVLANDQPFDFYLESQFVFFRPFSSPDFFEATASVTVTLVNNPGDYDGNGRVDDADYLVWQAAMWTGDLAADGNYDRRVTEADRDVWQERLGTVYFVPESKTASYLFSIALTSILAGVRRRGRKSTAEI
jgi:hypothetical protein